MAAVRHSWCWDSSWSLCVETPQGGPGEGHVSEGERESMLARNGIDFYLKAHSQWHTSSNKVTPPNPPQTVLPTVEQTFKHDPLGSSLFQVTTPQRSTLYIFWLECHLSLSCTLHTRSSKFKSHVTLASGAFWWVSMSSTCPDLLKVPLCPPHHLPHFLLLPSFWCLCQRLQSQKVSFIVLMVS